MAHAETLTLVPTAPAHEAAAALFARVAADLASLLPASAEIRHIGATAVPGCLTKGDLDIVVRVDAADFATADALLAARFARNEGSVRTDDFAAFEAPEAKPHLGIQLTVKGGALDDFHRFAALLRTSPAIRRRYNELKCRFDGQPMEVYRTAKAAFIADVLPGKDADRT